MYSASAKIGVILLLLIVGITGSALFFEDQFAVLASLLHTEKGSEVDMTGRTVNIAYLFAPTNLNPFSGDTAVQNRLLDVYEPLIRVDENLNMQPQLAVTYGLYSDRMWEFRVRQGVKFHDGKELSVQDVLFSFNQAKARPGSVAADLVASVESIDALGDDGLLITTRKPDPLLLIKLSKLPIIEDGFDDFDHPIGTGPLRLADSNDFSSLVYTRFADYWGRPSYFGRVKILSLPERTERTSGLINGDIDLLVDVPPDAVQELESQGVSVITMPSLEVGFAMFNFRDELFSKLEIRKAIAETIDKSSLLELSMGQATVLNQFIPSGVFGYDPDLVGISQDLADAKATLAGNDAGFSNLTVNFYFPESLKLLGQYFAEQLKPVGFEVLLKPLSDDAFQKRLQDGDMGFYYMGWKHETGDALPFLQAIVHSRDSYGHGIYNGGNYSNMQVDQLIGSAETNLNLEDRLRQMQQILSIVVKDDVIGVPLFETRTIYAHKAGLYWAPRVDSLLFPSSIRQL